MPVFSSFVGRGIDSHSPGNDCHTSIKSQPPTGPTTSNEAVKGPCSWTVATNTSWSSPTAQQQTPTAVLPASASTEKRCTAWTSFPSAPPSPPSSSACVNLEPSNTQRAAKVFKNALWMHDKEEVDTAGGQKVHILCMDTYSFTFSLGRVTLELICMRLKLQKEGHNHF